MSSYPSWHDLTNEIQVLPALRVRSLDSDHHSTLGCLGSMPRAAARIVPEGTVVRGGAPDPDRVSRARDGGGGLGVHAAGPLLCPQTPSVTAATSPATPI